MYLPQRDHPPILAGTTRNYRQRRSRSPRVMASLGVWLSHIGHTGRRGQYSAMENHKLRYSGAEIPRVYLLQVPYDRTRQDVSQAVWPPWRGVPLGWEELSFENRRSGPHSFRSLVRYYEEDTGWGIFSWFVFTRRENSQGKAIRRVFPEADGCSHFRHQLRFIVKSPRVPKYGSALLS